MARAITAILLSVRRARKPAALAVAVLGFAGCGGKTIIPAGAEKVVRDVVAAQTGFHPADVRCPSGVAGKVGGTFDCHFTGPDGPNVARMTIQSIQGSRVNFGVRVLPPSSVLGSAVSPRDTVVPGAAAQTVRDFVASHTGFRPTDVTCPPGVPAKASGTFDCHFTGPEGPYVAHVAIASVRGRRVLFNIQSLPASGVALNAAGSAQTVVDFVARRFHFHVADARCPSVTGGHVGTRFDCHFTGPDGRYVAHMRVVSIQSRRVNYDIVTTRIG